MIGNNTNEIIDKFFSSLLINRYQIDLEIKLKCSYFIFDSIDGMYYKCHRINLNRYGSNIDSLD